MKNQNADIWRNHLECCACGHRWDEPAGRGEPQSGKCPRCSHLYFRWLNYTDSLIEQRRAANEELA